MRNHCSRSKNSEISKPRTPNFSRFRGNAGVDSNEDSSETDSCGCYFRRNIYYPFLDHCISEFENCFPDPSKSIFVGCKLIPNNALAVSTEELESKYGYFAPDLPSEATFKAEFEVWKNTCASLTPTQRCNFRLIEALKLADKDFFQTYMKF